MTPTPAAPPLPVVPQDALDFAAEQGVAQYLPPLLELLPRVFLNARNFTVTVEDDPELANERHIVFDVYLPSMGPEVLEAKHRWNRETLQICPATQICLFRLVMNQAP
jgi:hypothetical protein